MTDQIPAGLTPEEAKAAREWATDYLKSGAGSERVRAAARVLLAVLPKPTTLADMPREERASCKWMQADVKGRSARYVIATPSDRSGLAGLVSADGGIEWTYPERVTPRPDLPRLQWPGDQETEDTTTAKIGDVIESADDPRLADLPVGTILLDRDGDEAEKATARGYWDGVAYNPTDDTNSGPWTIKHIPEP